MAEATTKFQPGDFEKLSGLSVIEAQDRLKEFGPNVLPQGKPVTNLAILLRALREPMVLLLVACAALYSFLGEFADGLLLLGSVFVVIGISFYQEHKSERALDALKKLSSPRALVIRDGQNLRIPGADVVPGDILIISEGDRIPADARLLSSNSFRVDESLLTGESFPVSKNASDPVYSGSMAIGGRSIAEVLATGSQTQLGKIGKSLEETTELRTPLQLSLGKLVKVFGIAGVGTSILITVIYALTREDWLTGLLVGLSSAMSLLPEEFAVVLTIFLATGAWRLSKKNVLIRKMSAAEALGSVTVLCVDKTGTLTENQMKLQELHDGSRRMGLDGESVPEQFHTLMEYAALASHVNPFDPMERAIFQALHSKLADTEHIHRDWELIKEYPLTPELFAMTCVWQPKDTTQSVVSVKGAPEAIFDLCHFSREEILTRLREVEELSERGLRVLAVAKAATQANSLPENQRGFEFEYLGLLGLEDPPRDGVPQAIADCYKAGIRVIMITGDYSGTASSIASKISLKNPGEVITGSELQSLSDEEFKSRIGHTNVFARMIPEEKLRIVKALQSHKEVVAMTGDGVNDAPSLKAADVGVAMGKRGTDVAREASDIVLLDDNFATLVSGIKQGRAIYDNIQKAIAFILAIHIPIAGLAMLPVLFNLPLLLLAPQIVFLELIIDPSCTLVFDGEEPAKDIMGRPPRRLDSPILTLKGFFLTGLRGVIILFATMGLFVVLLKNGRSVSEARTFTFFLLILSNLSLIQLSRQGFTRGEASGKPNFLFAGVLALSILLMAATLLILPIKEIFQFSNLELWDIATLLPLVFAVFLLSKLSAYLFLRKPLKD